MGIVRKSRMKQVFNRELRKMIIDKGLRMKDVAKAAGLNPCYLSQMFSHELRDYEKARIKTAIAKAEKDLVNGEEAKNQVHA